MKNIKDICIRPQTTIRYALEIIDNFAMRIALIINENQEFLGTLTDGDIRRGLLNGKTLEDDIEELYFKNPITAKINESKEKIIQKAIINQIYQIPILDENDKLVDIVNLATLLNTTKKETKLF